MPLRQIRAWSRNVGLGVGSRLLRPPAAVHGQESPEDGEHDPRLIEAVRTLLMEADAGLLEHMIAMLPLSDLASVLAVSQGLNERIQGAGVPTQLSRALRLAQAEDAYRCVVPRALRERPADMARPTETELNRLASHTAASTSSQRLSQLATLAAILIETCTLAHPEKAGETLRIALLLIAMTIALKGFLMSGQRNRAAQQMRGIAIRAVLAERTDALAEARQSFGTLMAGLDTARPGGSAKLVSAVLGHAQPKEEAGQPAEPRIELHMRVRRIA